MRMNKAKAKKGPKRYEQGPFGHFHVYCKHCDGFIGGSWGTKNLERWKCSKCGKVGAKLKEVS